MNISYDAQNRCSANDVG